MGPCVRRDDSRDGLGLTLVPTLNQQVAQITPFEIFSFDKLDLPISLPALQLLLAGNRFVRTFVRFDAHQTKHPVRLDERGALAVAMLLQPFFAGSSLPRYTGCRCGG